MALTDTQRGVVRGIALAAGVTLASFAAVLVWRPAVVGADDLASRLALALTADLIVAICLALSIGALAGHRFFTAADIDGGLGDGTEKARLLQSMLQNTLEQSLLAVLAHLIFAVLAPQGWLGFVPVAAILFGLGRILFWRGYATGAPGRAIGFALTFYPSVLMLMCCIGFAIARLVG